MQQRLLQRLQRGVLPLVEAGEALAGEGVHANLDIGVLIEDTIKIGRHILLELWLHMLRIRLGVLAIEPN